MFGFDVQSPRNDYRFVHLNRSRVRREQEEEEKQENDRHNIKQDIFQKLVIKASDRPKLRVIYYEFVQQRLTDRCSSREREAVAVTTRWGSSGYLSVPLFSHQNFNPAGIYQSPREKKDDIYINALSRTDPRA